MKLKYIIFKSSNSLESFIIFDSILEHSSVLNGKEVISAGFCGLIKKRMET
jgi:hypothetical protein